MLQQVDQPHIAIPLHLNPKHPVKLAQVCHFEVLLQALDELNNDAASLLSDGTVIHMDSYDQEDILVRPLLVEDSLVDLALLKAKLCKD